MIGLTPMQGRCLQALDEMIEGGVAPSVDQMRERLDLASKSGVIRLYDALEERGFIRRIKHRARAVEVLRRPPPKAPPTPAELNRFGTPELLDLLAHVCGILGHRLGAAKVRETLDRIGARLAGVRHG